ncbi:cupin domain-containing protein [Actinokineospora enzanensis]|uniref:cupin domain-containing protein n=1 Tax=Actinokineospora enzanensis TaxID=155975 RepID=UPI000373084C|nr:cupin domain-containing protein [Actinokineospora enzanensis]
MELRSLDRSKLGPDNGFSQPLVPWPALNAPFKGAWCVVHPGGSSTKHAHHDYEIFIAVSGEAVLESNGERVAFRQGDIVHFPPHTEHQVFNHADEDFQMYTVWWDTDLAAAFAERHEASS